MENNIEPVHGFLKVLPEQWFTTGLSTERKEKEVQIIKQLI